MESYSRFMCLPNLWTLQKSLKTNCLCLKLLLLPKRYCCDERFFSHIIIHVFSYLQKLKTVILFFLSFLFSIGRLLQLILGVAVNCDQKQQYIESIMYLEESIQEVIMKGLYDKFWFSIMGCKR